MAESLSTGGLIALALHRHGLGPIFTLNGGHIWGLYLGAEELGLPLLDVRHEQSAVFAAEGWAKVTRRCGVAAVTAGPGVTNSISGLAGARMNDSPLLLLGGRSPVARWGMGSLQEMDHLPLVAPLAKSAATIFEAERAYSMTVDAIRTATSGRGGPAYLDVPLDVFFGAADTPAPQPAAEPDLGPAPDTDVVAAVAGMIRQAERPAIVAGGSVWWAHAEEELARLAEAASLPVVLNGMARGCLPPEHPLFATRARAVALGQADLVLVVGVPLDFRLNFGQPPVFAAGARIVYVDVDGFRKHRPPAAALEGDLRAALAALAGACEGIPARPDWLETVRVAEAGARARDLGMTTSDATPIHPARLVAEVERFADPDAVIVGDGGDFVSFAGRLVHRRRPGLWVDAGPYGCLGAGPGYAIAAQLANPGRQVILLSGDGAFGFSAMEFETMVRHRLPVVCVVGNNGIWGLEKHPMQAMLGTSILADLAPGIRYDQVVAALGGHGELVERSEEIRPALERAFRSGLPACVNVICDPEAEYPRSAVLM